MRFTNQATLRVPPFSCSQLASSGGVLFKHCMSLGVFDRQYLLLCLHVVEGIDERASKLMNFERGMRGLQCKLPPSHHMIVPRVS